VIFISLSFALCTFCIKKFECQRAKNRVGEITSKLTGDKKFEYGLSVEEDTVL